MMGTVRTTLSNVRSMTTLFILICCGTVGAPAASWSEIASPTVKIGILTVFEAYGADYAGKGSLVAAQMAVDDFGGKINGRPIEIVSADTLQKADLASTIARKWYDQDHVDAIFDVPNSAVALAVLEIARERNKIMVTGQAGSTRISGKNCAPTVMQWVFDTYNLSAGTARAVLKHGGDSWFFLETDYTFGHDLAAAASAAVQEGGGKVLGKALHPLNTPDLSSFILQAQQSKAKIIGLAEGPPDNFTAIKQGREFGVAQGGQTMVPFLAAISDIHAVGLAAAQGLFLTTGWYWDMDEQSRAWANRYFSQMHKMPTEFHAGLYSAITHYLKAVKAADTTEGTTVAAKMHALPVEDMFAKTGHVRPDGRMAYHMLLVQVKSPEQSKYPWDYYTVLNAIPIEDAFLPLKDSECPLVK
jgi:branched-chain amino acid transport system substrate-binding protein